jgi:hypothetical protein
MLHWPGSDAERPVFRNNMMEDDMRTATSVLTLVSIALTSAVPLGASASAQQQTVTFRCGAQQGQTCFFSILPQNGGISNFTIKGGQTHQQSGLWPGKDRYIVTIDRPTPADWAKCQAQVGGWCSWGVVKSGINQ